MTGNRWTLTARRWPMRALGSIAIALVAFGGLGPARAQQVTAEPLDLLEYYNLGQYDAVRGALASAASGDLGVVLQALKQDAGRWIAADGPRLAARRRLTAATFALEAARAGLDHQWLRSQEILEWACQLLGKERQPTAAERTWHLAALALVEGSRDMKALALHASHLRARFPDEPRVLMAVAFQKETEYWDLIYSIQGVADGGSPGAVIPALTAARTRPGNQREADLRLGYLLHRSGKPREAIEVLARVGEADDVGQRYLAQLFLGWAYEALEKPGQAERAFRAALDAVPGAEVATLALAVRLYTAGRRDEADTLTDEMLRREPRVLDPWRIYGYGDLRRWPLLMDKLREELQAQ